MSKTTITVEAFIAAPVQKVWECWTLPEHIVAWNTASDDWHTPRATNDLRVGGKFLSRMEARDGSMGFDFEGIYSIVDPCKKIAYGMADGRTASVDFIEQDGSCRIIETFDAEEVNSIELQRGGWQSILNNFKKYTEALS